MTLLFIFFVFVNTPCGHWWHSQVFWLFNYVCFSKSHFKLNARNSLKSLTVSIDSEPEVEPFITQTKAASVAVLQELSENNLNLQFAGAENEQAVDNFNFRTEDLSTDLSACLQTKNIPGEGSLQGNSVEE